MISFFVPGIPQPGGSKRAFVVKGRAVVTEDARKSKDWRASVALAASGHFTAPLSGPVVIEFHFVFPRPRGHFGTGKNADSVRASAPSHHITKPDCTKLTRSTEDALKGIAWGDDSQVVSQAVTKRYGERPGCQITIRSLASDGPTPQISLIGVEALAGSGALR